MEHNYLVQMVEYLNTSQASQPKARPSSSPSGLISGAFRPT